jgi:hypothetical protein
MSSLFDVVNHWGVIRQVRGRIENFDIRSPMFQVIVFTFDEGSFSVRAVIEDDSILISFAEALGEELTDLHALEPWNRVIGHGMMFIWTLENQSGYRDGLQFECALPEEFLSVQLMCMASALDVQVFSQQKYRPEANAVDM